MKYPEAIHFGVKPYEVIASLGIQLFGPSIDRFIPSARIVPDKNIKVRYPLQLS